MDFRNLLLASTAIIALTAVAAPATAGDGIDQGNSATLTANYAGSDGAAGGPGADGTAGYSGLRYTSGAITVTASAYGNAFVGGDGGAGGAALAPNNAGRSGGTGGNGVTIPNFSGATAAIFPTLNLGYTPSYFTGMSVQGGSGGAGGTGGAIGGVGGTGGAGGDGIYTDTSYTQININSSNVYGGTGGTGGAGLAVSGGNGGAGVHVGADASNVVINNNCPVSGGTGGVAGTGAAGSTTAANGVTGDSVLIEGANATFYNAGLDNIYTTGNGVHILNNMLLLYNEGGILSHDGGNAVFLDNSRGNYTLGTLYNNNEMFTLYGNGNAIYNQLTITLLNNQGSMYAGYGGGTVINNAGTITTLMNANNAVLSVYGGLHETGILNTGTITTLLNNGGDIVDQGNSGDVMINNQAFIGTLNNNGGQITAMADNGVAIANIYNSVAGSIGTITNSGGRIAVTNGYAINSNMLIGTLDNTNGTISATSGVALRNAGTLNALTNANGTIGATTGVALELDAAIGAPVNNAGGLITSANNTGFGTIYLAGDASAFEVDGGTISNTATMNAATAIYIAASQSGADVFNGVTITADGATAGSGGGNAILAAGVADIYVIGGSVLHGNISQTTAASFRLTVDGAITGNITTLGGGSTLDLQNGAITGTITLGNGANTLTQEGGTIAGNVTLGNATNLVTLSGGALNGNLSFANASANTLNLSGGAINGAITAGVAATTINVNATYVTAGDIVTVTGGATALNVAGGAGLTANNPIMLGAGNFTVAAGSSFDLAGGNLTTSGSFTNAGVTEIGAGRTLAAGSFVAGTAGRLVYDMQVSGGRLVTGVLNAGTSAADFSRQAVALNFTGNGLLAPDARSLIATGTGAAVAPDTVTGATTYLYRFSVAPDPVLTNDLFLTAARAPLQNAAGTTNNYNASTVLLNGLAATADPQIQQIQTALVSASTGSQYNKTLAATLPTVDNGNAASATALTGRLFDLADGQLATVTTGDVQGVAAGDSVRGLHPWLQAFGGYASQSERSAVPGYTAASYGVAVGLDTRELRRDTVVGLSASYGRANVASDNANNSQNNVNTYQVMAYGNHNFGDDLFVTGMAAFGWDQNSQARYAVGAIEGLNASARFGAWQAGTRGLFGKNYHIDQWLNGLTLTPAFVAEYVHYNQQAYDESGAGGADLHVNNLAEDNFYVGPELRSSLLVKGDDGLAYKPDVHVGYKYNALNDNRFDATSSFAAGGTTFSTNGLAPSRSTVDFGVDLRLYSADHWDLTAAYDHMLQPQYSADTGFIRAAYEF